MTKAKLQFNKGYLKAMSNMVAIGDVNHVVKELFISSGFKKDEDLSKYDLDEYDIENIEKVKEAL